MTLELFEQGPGVYIPVLLISLLITLLAYGVYPLLFAKFRKKPISETRYKLKCWGFNVIPMLLFFLLSDRTPAGPYLLWTSVFCHSGLKTLKRRNIIADSEVAASTPSPEMDAVYTGKYQQPNAPTAITSKTKQRYCKLCGGAIDQETKKCTGCGKQYFRFRIDRSSAFFGTVILLALAIGLVGFYRISEYQQHISKLSDRITELEAAVESKSKTIDQYEQQISDKNKRSKELLQEKNELKQKVDFYDKNIVFVLDDNTNRYHKYDCVVFQYSDKLYWAYNIEAAKYRGYTSCFACD